MTSFFLSSRHAATFPPIKALPFRLKHQLLFGETTMIRKLKSGGYRLYSLKKDRKTGRRRNLGTFPTRAAAQKHERAVQFFKRRGHDANPA